jgi:hypothetical protein
MNASTLKASCYNPKLHMHGVGGQDDKPFFFPIVVSMFNFLRIFRSRPPAMEPLITIVGATGTGKSKVR